MWVRTAIYGSKEVTVTTAKDTTSIKLLKLLGVEVHDKAFSVIDMLKEHDLNGDTVIRGFGAVWERKAAEIL